MDRDNQGRRGVTYCPVYSFKYTPFCFQLSLRANGHKS